jgi:hypothetical protein
MSFVEALNQTARVYRGTVFVDSLGEERIAWQYVDTVRCRVRLTRPYPLVKLGVQELVTAMILTEYLPRLKEEPKARWRFDVDDGRTYLVVYPKDPMGRRHHLENAARVLDEVPSTWFVLADGAGGGEEFGAPEVIG